MAFNGQKIVGNTIVLYLRLFAIIVLSFYTSRVLLQTLGIEDFGLYNIVGGIAAMFASLKSSFASATQRFYNYEIGKRGNTSGVTEIFNMSMAIHIGIAVILFVVLEVVGIYMINNVLSIPTDRLHAANIILQITIVSTMISTVSIPFDAMLMAREKMGYYALISVIDAIAKLGLILLLRYLDGDMLIYYGMIMLLISILNLAMSSVYCFAHFPDCKFRANYDKTKFKEMFVFGGWNFAGNVGFSMCQEVNNFFLNIFGGVVANASRGVVYQLRAAIMQFLSNALIALRPQATQEYAAQNYGAFFQIVSQATKMVYFIALCMALPLFIYAEDVFALWLEEVPQYAVIFLRVILIHMMIRSFHEPIDLIYKSVGKLKGYQLISLCTQVAILPISYIALKQGAHIYWVFINMCIAEIIELVLIVCFASRYGLNIKDYLRSAIMPILGVTMVSAILAILVSLWLNSHFIVSIVIVIITTIITIICVGFNRQERSNIKALILKMIKR